MLDRLTLDLVRQAHERIVEHVVRTPTLQRVRPSGCELLLKAECLQPTGAFKLRGAFHLMSTLPSDCPGVVAHSSGNHAQAVARAARVLGLRAAIVMPSDAPPLKRSRTEADGAEVITVGPDSEERARRADEIVQERDWVLVPPFDDVRIAAGQGTAALEMLEDAGALDRFYAPVSGGGLMAGCAVVVAGICPGAEIIAVEPATRRALTQSLEKGERVTVPAPDTIADGLRVRAPGRQTWPVLQRHVDRVATVTDAELLDAMSFALIELRVVLEPSGAAALAVALREDHGRCGVILSGGNVDPSRFFTRARNSSNEPTRG